MSAAPTFCTSNTVGWVDYLGDGCNWHESADLPGCPSFVHYYDWGDIDAANDNAAALAPA